MTAIRLTVVGDAMLDVDLIGRATRLTPDAPVPVLDDLHEHVRPGGAALAALVAARAGARVTLVTGLCDDDAAQRLLDAIARAGHGLPHGPIEVLGIPVTGHTAVKRRVRAGGQSLVRLDSGAEPGDVGRLTREGADAVAAADAVLVSDYGRGLTAAPSVRVVLAAATTRRPVVWDPHPRGTAPVPGVALATPNASEARTWAARAGSDVSGGDRWPAVAARAAALRQAWSAEVVAVTLGERGALLATGRGVPRAIPAAAVGGTDACGAGDAFAATAAVGLSAGHDVVRAVQDAVTVAADFVAAGGAAGLDETAWPGPPAARRSAVDVIESTRSRGGIVVATGGCFDLLHAGHVASLESARRLGDALVVCLNSDQSVRALKGPGRPVQPADDRRRVLEALACVDAVEIFDETEPSAVLSRLRPDVWAKGGDYASADLPERAVLDRWGGQAVTLPYLSGHSTTALVTAITNDHHTLARSNR